MQRFVMSLLVMAAATCGTAAQAVIVDTRNGNVLAAYYYLSQTYGEIKDINGNNLQEGGAITDSPSIVAPSTQSVNLSQSGSNLTTTTSASLSGFARAHTSASAQVSNASAILGYTSVGSYGFRTQVQFNSSQTPGQVVFNFNVSGSSSQPFGGAGARLDFLADGSPSGSFFDVFFDPNAQHYTGAGAFQYTYNGSTASPLDIMFYSASYALIVGNTGFPAATNGANFTSFADFSNTFDLTSIQLYTANGELITDWSLVDTATNSVVFTQAGRVEQVPEPATLALLGAGLLGLAATRRRKA